MLVISKFIFVDVVKLISWKSSITVVVFAKAKKNNILLNNNKNKIKKYMLHVCHFITMYILLFLLDNDDVYVLGNFSFDTSYIFLLLLAFISKAL